MGKYVSLKPVEEIGLNDVKGVEAEDGCERFEAEDEAELVRKITDPRLPSQKDVDEHWIMGHPTYRNWCEVCACEGKR